MTFEKKVYDVRLKTPFRFILAGPSECGKTTFVFNILRNQYHTLDKPTSNVIYFYKHWQSGFDAMVKENRVSEWVQAIPTVEMLQEKTKAYKDGDGSIVVIDDLMQDIDEDIADLFTAISHSLHISVFLLSQNVFQTTNKWFRTISLQVTYMAIFKNPRDSSQFTTFAKQFTPGNTKWLTEVFEKCTKAAYSYIMFNMHQTTDHKLRVFTKFLPNEGEGMIEVWMDKDEPT
jgi:Poxvirus A32 protein